MPPQEDDFDLRLTALTTEARNPDSMSIDALSAIEIVGLMNSEDATIAAAVATQARAIADVIEIITDRLRRGGRLIYMGAGTSGRLGVLDATECPPTFNTRPEQVVGLIAGGRDALVRAVEGAEDYREFGAGDLDSIHVDKNDVVVGIATSGRTPYVVGGLDHARTKGAVAVGLTCNRDSALQAVADHMIVPVVGPEVISGSTRLKAGTATKLVLNMLTTGAMVRLGKTYGNLMVDLRATNQKLTDRSRRIVATVTGVDDKEAMTLLRSADGELKTAIVMRLANTTAENAREQLESCHGHLRTAVHSIQSQGHGSDRPSSEYVLGVDGGGSRTVAWLMRASGDTADPTKPLGQGISGPANPQSVGPIVAKNNLARAILASFEDAQVIPHPVAALCLAVAGAGRADRRQQLEQWARSNALANEIVVTTDADAVVDAVDVDGPMIVLIAGTGSIALGRDADGGIHRSGGWGYLVGDEGSGYAIALAALRMCTRASDGRQDDAAPLRDAILRELELHSVEAFINHTYSQLATDRRQLAKLARVVLRMSEQGDAVSVDILDKAARELAELAKAVADHLGTKATDVALAGGLLVGSASYRDRVQSAMAVQLGSVPTWHVVEHPTLGAVRRARRLIAT